MFVQVLARMVRSCVLTAEISPGPTGLGGAGEGRGAWGRPPGVPSRERPCKVLKISGDTNHARAYCVTEPPRSKGPDQELQLVPGLSSDFKDCWPSRRGVCQDKVYLTVLARRDTDLPF